MNDERPKVPRPHGSALNPPMLTYAQVGALTGRSVSTVEKWVRNRSIPFHRLGRNVRFDPAEIRQWLEENEIDSDNRIVPARPLRRWGVQHVFPSDTIGDTEHCWCGDVINHDWEGKDKGAPHPHEHERNQQVVVVESEPKRNRIEKTDLRGYHATLKTFIIRCVNVDGLAWRGQKNGILLYPPDDSQPITVFCRNTDAQMRSLRQWYAAHVEPTPEPEPEAVTDMAAITRLAEKVNDPAEHPVRKPEQADELDPDVKPYVTGDGEESEFFVTDGKMVWCRVCVDTVNDYRTPITAIRGLGGHIRMNHTDTTTLYSPETREKALDSKRYNRLRDKVQAAVELLAETIDYTHDNARIVELEHALEKERKRADDAEARIKLMQEAFRGLE